MATIHLSSTGSNSSPYSTWATAATSFSTAVAAMSAADTLVVSSTDTISAAGINVTFPGTAASPSKWLSGVPDVTSGLASLAAGFILSSTTTTFLVAGTYFAYGILFSSDAGSSSAPITIGTTNTSYVRQDSCTYRNNSTGSTSSVEFGNQTAGGGGRVVCNNPSFKFASSGTRILYSGEVILKNVSIIAGGTSPTAFANTTSANRGGRLLVDGGDLSSYGAGLYLHGAGQGGNSAVFRGLKVPASWTGGPCNRSTFNPGQQLQLWESGNGSTYYHAWVEDYLYTLKTEPTIVMTSAGSSSPDGTTNFSWKLVTASSCSYPNNVARISDVMINGITTGSSKTWNLEIVNDGTTFTNADVWYELSAFTTSGQNQITVTTSEVALSNLLASATTNWGTSSATWTTTGITTPVKQTITVSATPQFTGPFPGRLCVAKASTTLYLNYRPSIT